MIHSQINIRRAEKTDADAMLQLVDALADYEKLPKPNAAARERLTRDCFGDKPRFEAFLADVDKTTVGYAFFFETYSSFLALPILFLEDLFVLPDHRKKRVGISLFTAVAQEAFRRGCGRMEWTVLDWNQLAIGFYNALGAQHLREWQLFRLLRKDIKILLESL